MVLGLDREVLTLALARMVDAIANSFLVVVLPLYIGSEAVRLPAAAGSTVFLGPVGVTVSEELLIGIVLSLFGFLNSLSQPFTGTLSDRTGRRKVYVLLGLGLVAVGSAGYLAFTDYGAILAMRALQGLGAAFTIPVTVALVNELSTGENRGGNFGTFNTFRLLGFGTGPLVAGAVVAAGPYELLGVALTGFDAAFLVAVVGAAVSFVTVTLFVSDPPELEGDASSEIAIQVRDPGSGLLDPVFALGAATVVMALGLAVYAPLGNVINDRLNQGSFLFSLQFGATVLANVVFQAPVGRLSDRFGRRPFLVGGFLVLLPAVAAQGLLLASPVGPAPELMVAARFVQGLGVAAVFAPALALAGDLAREGESGSTLSVLTMGFGLGIAFGTLLSGYLVSFGLATPFVFSAVLGVTGLVLVVTQVEETVGSDAAPDGEAPAPGPGD